ncbi:glycoside hydrolase family 7 protein [Laetiporus sulphureus 93-53]|uniref:Glucanase n=1 Tax=Laetiporus sulphureus 93-53 TaxID=1314785 RepID=A0A165D7C2_9APHY|nr:glycoside hydrolase family 7 protein [Laetiporus sulphureus 93-53]KZT04274.1 glycoside hydrolase family 7 protein [Laetiporus sulphureus 93-53]
MSACNSITDDYCVAQKTAFGDTDEFETLGGLAQLSEAFEAGMVLVLSLLDDYTVDMLWLDSDYPTDESASDPVVARGPCSTSSGVPAIVESEYLSSNVIYSNIKYGDIGTTY